MGAKGGKPLKIFYSVVKFGNNLRFFFLEFWFKNGGIGAKQLLKCINTPEALKSHQKIKKPVGIKY